MKMVTHLAGRQLEKDMAKKRNTTAMTSVMEEPISESKDDTGMFHAQSQKRHY